jgi:hypothetical protein
VTSELRPERREGSGWADTWRLRITAKGNQYNGLGGPRVGSLKFSCGKKEGRGLGDVVYAL